MIQLIKLILMLNRDNKSKYKILFLNYDFI